MSDLQAFVFTPVGTITAYIGIGVAILAFGWVCDQVLAAVRRK